MIIIEFITKLFVEIIFEGIILGFFEIVFKILDKIEKIIKQKIRSL